ncbi:MAG: hypothetical protein ACHQAQ_10185, partial [Hyphomicrobiales bacterium]
MQDIAREADFNDEAESREDLNADELISAAVAEAKRHVRRNELKTNSALDAISEWIEKSEGRRVEETKRLAAKTDTALDAISEWIEKSESTHAEETKRLATSQERVASAVRDALGLMTGRLNQIETLVAEAPARAFEPIRNALGRLDDRVSVMEGQRSVDERNTQHFSTMMDSLGQRLKEVVGKIDELADVRDRDDPTLREERIAGIEAKLGTILQQLSRPSLLSVAETPSAAAPSPILARYPVPAPSQAPAPPRPRVVLRSVTGSGKLDAAIADIRRKRDELGGAPTSSIQARFAAAPLEEDAGLSLASLRTELGALAIQLQRLEKGRIDPQTFNELLSTTSEVRRLLADPTMPRLAARLEQSVADLTQRVDALTTKVVDRGEIAALTAAISEIRASLSEPRPGADTGVVESRIEALSAKIDEVMREPLGLVGQHLADLSERLSSSTRAEAPSQAFTEIRDKLDRIVERADAPAVGQPPLSDSTALVEVRDRLDRLSAKLEQAPSGPDSGSIADLRDRLDKLALSIERSATTSAPDKIDRVLRQIAANMDAARLVDPSAGALQGLERQIAALAERVGGEPGSAGALGDLERSVSRLFDELADTKAAAIKAAEAAATGAASQAAEVGLALREDRAADEREMHSTLGQMSTTLERIMGRLSSLEEQTRQPAAASRGTRPPEPIGAQPGSRDALEAQGHGTMRAEAPAVLDELPDEIGGFATAARKAPRGGTRPEERVFAADAASAPARREPASPSSLPVSQSLPVSHE